MGVGGTEKCMKSVHEKGWIGGGLLDKKVAHNV
jgi:hypothetical protein